MACSTPPVYWSTGIHLATSAGSNAAEPSCGEQYRRKYQDESTNVSIVSVSRRAAPLHLGHFTSTKSFTCANGEAPLPEKGTSLGSMTGRSASGTGTVPHASQ